jgi:hypothetical protein
MDDSLSGEVRAAALTVAEAMHESGSSDAPELLAAIAGELHAVWSIAPVQPC